MDRKSEENAKLRSLDFEVLPEEERKRLDLFLNDRMTWRSRSSIQQLIEKGHVISRTRGSRLKASTRVVQGEAITVSIPIPKRELDLIEGCGDECCFEIIHDDQWVVAINKPAGIPVHPAGRLLGRTVITELRSRFAAKWGVLPEDIKLCHRLDLETSGVLLLSKEPISMPGFAGQFERREVEKEYLALVHGRMRDDRYEIRLPIGLAGDSIINMKRGICHETGQEAWTTCLVERRFDAFSLVRLRLHTGRHHQLRVHLSALGFPIVGDKLYGLDENFFLMYLDGNLTAEARKRLMLPRQALHAQKLTIHHVGLKRKITIEAPLPSDMTGFMQGLKG